MNNFKNIVRNYYPTIDNGNVGAILLLFSNDASYKRADQNYANISEITEFFRNKRQIIGLHIIDRIWSNDSGDVIFATGKFEGKGVAGDARSVEFADIWQFNAIGLVFKRQTFLALGHAYVEK